MQLSPDQVERFHGQGFLFLPELFTATEVAVLHREVPAILAQDRPVLRTWPELARAADRFAKGDDEAMRDLVRAGRPALRVLAERRREFPRDRREALARLMMEIRWATARSDDDRALLVPLGTFARLRCNPFFEVIRTRITQTLP